MDPEQHRKKAIESHLSGKSIVTICRELGMSRKWFYKWWNRYRSGSSCWFKDESKAPKTIPHKIESYMEELILSIRDRLEKTPYSQKGATAIAWEIHKLGHSVPPYWQINRVLKRNNRTRPTPASKREKSNVSYPYFRQTDHAGEIYQADLVGPRYIKDDGRFYVFNTIDLYHRAANSVAIRSKDDDLIVLALIDTWKKLGIPEFLQLDNDLIFRGSNRYPHSLGKVLKLCLAMGIQPVFIPLGEPWRNGIIEHFNYTFDDCFYSKEHFENYDHLNRSLANFIIFHNEHHLYSATGGKTPQQILSNESIKPDKLPADYCLPVKTLSRSRNLDKALNIPNESYIHIIRFIRSDLLLNVWGERFKMPKEVMYQYVRATIYTEFHLLNVFLVDKLIAQFEYKLPNFNQTDPNTVLKELLQNLRKYGIDIT